MSGQGRREPWNARAVRCVVEHIIPVMKPHPGHAIDKLVLIDMARHAHPDGGGITVGKYSQAEWSGSSDRSVWDARRRLRRDGWIARTAQRTGARGSDTYRIVCPQRCYSNTAEPTASGVVPQPLKTPPAGPREAASGVAATPEQKVLGVRTSLTSTIPEHGTPARPPDGQRPGDGPPSPDPSRVVSSAADLSSPQDEDDHQTTPGLPGEPWDQGKASTGPGPRPVPGRSPNGSAPGGAARPQSREPLGASTGDPFSNPRADQSDDDTFWTQGEAALWDAAQAMEAELFELAGYCDPGRFAR